jgi:hypothetical protein
VNPIRRPGGPAAPLLAALLAAVSLQLCAGPAAAQSDPANSDEELVDRIVAVVDEDPILASELEEVIGLGLAEARAGETVEQLRGRVLAALIDERLRFHEVDRFGFEQVPVTVIEQRLAEIRSRFGGEAAFRAPPAELETPTDELRQPVARQLMVLTYGDARLGARVFVSLDDIREYYDQTLVPAMRARNETPPPIDTVREDIRALLKEQRLNEEIQRWTEELRSQADVEVFLDTPGPLPPVVYRVGRPPGP